MEVDEAWRDDPVRGIDDGASLAEVKPDRSDAISRSATSARRRGSPVPSMTSAPRIMTSNMEPPVRHETLLLLSHYYLCTYVNFLVAIGMSLRHIRVPG